MKLVSTVAFLVLAACSGQQNTSATKNDTSAPQSNEAAPQVVDCQAPPLTGNLGKACNLQDGSKGVCTWPQGFFLPECSAEALRVDGEKATKLIAALVSGELKQSVISGGFKIDASDVKCEYTPHGFIWANCNLTDKHDADLTKSMLPNQAFALMTALKDAGIEWTTGSDTFVEGSVSVNAIACTRGGFVAGDRCSITK